MIPEAFFKPPYFYHGAPSYFKYGAAGMAFAHEMMHAFDFTGKDLLELISTSRKFKARNLSFCVKTCNFEKIKL